jgi:heme-degrading monooxygenase HmoA
MILECALLHVTPGEEATFERAFEQAKPLICAQPGFLSVRLERCIERPAAYVLLVEWQTLESHTEGFRTSAEYPQWRGLLHHFYDEPALVEHYTLVSSG